MRFLLVALLAMTGLSGCLSDEPIDAADADTDLPIVEFTHEDVAFQDTVSITAGTDVATMGCGQEGTIDTAESTWTIEPPAGSNQSHVIDMVLTFSWGPSMVDVDFVVYDPAGTELARSTAFNAGQSSQIVPVDGKHSTGDFRIVVLGCYGTGDVSIDGKAVLGHAA